MELPDLTQPTDTLHEAFRDYEEAKRRFLASGRPGKDRVRLAEEYLEKRALYKAALKGVEDAFAEHEAASR